MSSAATQEPAPTWITTYRGFVHGVDCDLMAHLNTARAAAIFDAATWKMLSVLGYRWTKTSVLGWADVKNTVYYQREVPVDTPIVVRTAVTHVGRTSLTLQHELWVEQASEPSTRFEAVLVQFDLQRKCSTPISEDVRLAATAQRGAKSS